MALTLGLLIAAALWLRRRDFGVLAVRRPKPATEPPLAGRGHDLEIEAELQEMLAEENARRLHGMANAP